MPDSKNTSKIDGICATDRNLSPWLKRRLLSNTNGIREEVWSIGQWLRNHVAIVDALRQQPEGEALARQLYDCTDHRPCRLAVCVWCRFKRVKKVAYRLEQQFGGRESRNVGWVTILVRLCANYKEVDAAIKLTKRKLRNLLFRLNQKIAPGAVRYSAFGCFEVDSYRSKTLKPESKGSLGSYKQKALSALGVEEFVQKQTGVVHLLHLHCIMSCSSRAQLKTELSMSGRFPYPYQVKVKGLHGQGSRSDNLKQLASYMLKLVPRYAADGAEGFRPFFKPSRMRQWCEWMGRRGLQRLTFRFEA